jgi:hypothetical protein
MSLKTVSSTFSNAGVSAYLNVRDGDSLTYAVDYSADFDGGLFLERSLDGGMTHELIRTLAVGYKTDVTTTTIEKGKGLYRFRCIIDPAADPAVLTGTAAITLADVSDQIYEFKDKYGDKVLEVKEDGIVVPGAVTAASAAITSATITSATITNLSRTNQTLMISAADGKVGNTAGWVISGANDLPLVTLPQSKTASTLVIPITPLKVGTTISGFFLVGQVEGTSGNTATLNCQLREVIAAAGDMTDALIGSMTQVSVTADTALTSANTTKTLSEVHVVAQNEAYYLLITGTTGVGNDVALAGVGLIINEV